MPDISHERPEQTAIWVVRDSARTLAGALARALGARVFPKKAQAADSPELTGSSQTADQNPAEDSNREQFRRHFHEAGQWVLVMASGIATRYLSGLPRDKRTDPAVVVVDEACRYAIPLLSGHEGGGNALAYRIGAFTGATPVITTATEALKPLTLGIGCRKGVSRQKIAEAVQSALSAAGASLEQVREVATVDLKASEPGLLEWLASTTPPLPLRVFSSQDLAQRPLTATPSDWVRRSVGLAGVCEPCALLASPRGRLILPKTAKGGVTIALVSDATHHLDFLSCPAS